MLDPSLRAGIRTRSHEVAWAQMSLLDRVQRKAEGTPAPAAPGAPATPASAPPPERATDPEKDRFAPAAWQTNQSTGQTPLPQTAPTIAPVRPVEAERVAPAELQRSPSLLNRTGGLNRTGLNKM